MKSSIGRDLIMVRQPDSIFQAHGIIENGTFDGRWHFSFDQYFDRDFSHFGTLRVFNDDTLSPGATWPLHSHRNIEVVTYCAAGVFRHADQDGRGNILRKGWVQHTTVGRGMSHSEINDNAGEPMRFIQMWFLPRETDLEPSLQQKPVERAERTSKLLALVSNQDEGALPIASDARVFSSFLGRDMAVGFELDIGRAAYLYVIEGGPVRINGHEVPALGAARIIGGQDLRIKGEAGAELLFVEVPLAVSNRAMI
ncbi:MAG: pirin family protein [Actinobacteria bacterium]|nr:pirin family protein [Actinomycetota bacterium]